MVVVVLVEAMIHSPRAISWNALSLSHALCAMPGHVVAEIRPLYIVVTAVIAMRHSSPGRSIDETTHRATLSGSSQPPLTSKQKFRFGLELLF